MLCRGPSRRWFSEATLFSKIISREIPATILYEDAKCIAFRDIAPVAPTHVLIVPIEPIPGLSATTSNQHTEILGHLLSTAKHVAEQEKLDQGYRIVINDGEHGCQSVPHLHVHLVGGRQLSWPPG